MLNLTTTMSFIHFLLKQTVTATTTTLLVQTKFNMGTPRRHNHHQFLTADWSMCTVLVLAQQSICTRFW